MDKHKKLSEEMLKADGINPTQTSETEKIAFGRILDRQLKMRKSVFFVYGKNLIKFAAAAMILIALICWFGVNDISRPEYQDSKKQDTAEKSQTAAELMTLSSLRTAMRNGGTEAVEQQFNEAFKMLGPRPNNLSAKDL